MQYLQKTVPTHHTSPQKLWIDGSKTITRPDLGRCHTQLASVLDRHSLSVGCHHSAPAWVTTKHTYNPSTSFYLLLFHHVSTWDMSLRISLNCQAMWKPASQLRVIGFKGVTPISENTSNISTVQGTAYLTPTHQWTHQWMLRRLQLSSLGVGALGVFRAVWEPRRSCLRGRFFLFF